LYNRFSLPAELMCSYWNEARPSVPTSILAGLRMTLGAGVLSVIACLKLNSQLARHPF
jgi:hypothetical protein